jgi:hypothetical protein
MQGSDMQLPCLAVGDREFPILPRFDLRVPQLDPAKAAIAAIAAITAITAILD